MTVEELIEKLSKMPPTAVVRFDPDLPDFEPNYDRGVVWVGAESCFTYELASAEDTSD